MFDGPTPALWPLTSRQIQLNLTLETTPNKPWLVKPRLELLHEPSPPERVELANGKTLLLLAVALTATLAG